MFREIVIPGDVLCDERLSDGAKIMYGKIARLSLSDGYCWASNAFLDGTQSGRNASRAVAELKETGYISVENERSKARKIRVRAVDSRLNPANSGDVEESGNPNLAKFGDVEESGNTNPAKFGDVEESENTNLANSGDVEKPEKPNPANFGEVKDPENANLAKFGDRTSSSSSYIYNKSTTTSGSAEISRDDLKRTVSELGGSLVLGDNFYEKAPSFLQRNGLGPEYVSWIYEQCLANKPVSLNGYFFTVFFMDNKAEEFKAVRPSGENPPDEKPPPQSRYCPVCGTVCGTQTDVCPSCGLRDPCFNTSPGDLLKYRALYSFPPEKKDDYLSRENAVYELCGYDFAKLNSMLAALNKEFGIKADL